MSLAEVLCRTDSAEIIEKTILGDLTKAMKTVATKRLHIYKDTEGKVGCCFGAMPDGASFEPYSGIEVKMHVTGDLAFYAMALGRESMSGAWCFLCKLCRSQYADKNWLQRMERQQEHLLGWWPGDEGGDGQTDRATNEHMWRRLWRKRRGSSHSSLAPTLARP